MSRTKKAITKINAIEEYWDKHKNKLNQMFPLGERQFKTYMEENIEQTKYIGKRSANQAIRDEIDRYRYGSEYIENKQILREYAAINNIKASKFNNKKFTEDKDFKPMTFYGSTPWGATGEVSIDKVISISNSDLVIIKGTITLDTGSPIEYKDVINRSQLYV